MSSENFLRKLIDGQFLSVIVVGFVCGAISFVLAKLFLNYRIKAESHALSSMLFAIAVLNAVAVAINIGVSLVPDTTSPLILGPQEGWLERIHWSYVVSFSSMIFGMAASYLNKLINERRAIIEARRKTGDMSKPALDFDVLDFVQPFLVSLITYGAIVARIKADDVLNDVIMGFESGFFWQTIMSKRSTAEGG